GSPATSTPNPPSPDPTLGAGSGAPGEDFALALEHDRAGHDAEVGGLQPQDPEAGRLGRVPTRDDRRVVAHGSRTLGEAVPAGQAVLVALLPDGVALGAAGVVAGIPVAERDRRGGLEVGRLRRQRRGGD